MVRARVASSYHQLFTKSVNHSTMKTYSNSATNTFQVLLASNGVKIQKGHVNSTVFSTKTFPWFSSHMRTIPAAGAEAEILALDAKDIQR